MSKLFKDKQFVVTDVIYWSIIMLIIIVIWTVL